MFDLLPPSIFSNPNYRWLDMGAGTGYFSIFLYHKLFQSLENQIINPFDRKNHIIKNMIYMVEIKETHINSLKNIFGNKANIISINFLSMNKTTYPKFDIIIGNPPYNCNGQIKTPTNTKIEKKGDGITIWPDFIKKAISLLSLSGYLLAIIPAIWLKPDKAGIHKLLIGNTKINTKIKILKLHTLSTSETNKIFHYQAQTSTTYFLGGIPPLPPHQGENTPHSPPHQGENTPYLLPHQGEDISTHQGENTPYLLHHQGEDISTHQGKDIHIYDNSLQKYIEYPIYRDNISIPLSSISIIKKLVPYINMVGYLQVYKTNMPPSKSRFSLNQSLEYPYKNVKTCIFRSKKSICKIQCPEIIYEYSNIPQAFSNSTQKLILAHKMFGFAFLDQTGELGISYRDNYVIIDKSLQELEILKNFLSSKLVLAIYDATRYRMRYLEKYAFELIPDITKLNDFPTNINDKTIADYFNLSQEEREIIEKYPNYMYF